MAGPARPGGWAAAGRPAGHDALPTEFLPGAGASTAGPSAPGASSKAGASYLNLLLGCVPVKGVAESGFSYQEKNGLVPFRWTDGAAKLLVPVDAEHPPQRLWVSIGIYRPEPASVPFHVLVDGISLYEGPVPLGKWAINLDLSSHRFSEQAAVELRERDLSCPRAG